MLIYREARQVFTEIQESCKQIKREISALDGKCKDEMIKRFGPNVKFADIEAFAVNRTLEEMKELASREQNSQYRAMEKNAVLLLTHQGHGRIGGHYFHTGCPSVRPYVTKTITRYNTKHWRPENKRSDTTDTMCVDNDHLLAVAWWITRLVLYLYSFFCN